MQGVDRRGWVVLGAASMAVLTSPSFSFVAGVLHVAMLESSSDDVTIVTWIGSLYSCMFALSGPFASILINTWGCRACVIVSGLLGLVGFSVSSLIVGSRWLFLTYALLAGLGQGLTYTSCLVNVGYYFRERTSLATSIVILSCGIGNVVLPVLTQALIDNFHLDGAFLLIGAISFQACACGMVMKPSKYECIAQKKRMAAKNRETSEPPSAYKRFKPLLSNSGFWFFVASSFSYTAGASTIKLYLPDFFVTQGAAPDNAAMMVSYIGVGSIVSRFALGFAANDPKIDAAVLYSGVNVMTSLILTFIMHVTQSYLGQILFALAYGCYNGGCWTLFNPITYDLVGVDHLASAMGIVMFMCGAGYLIGAPVAGWIYKINQNYYSAFLFSAVAFFITGVCGIIAVSVNRGTDEAKRNKDEDMVNEIQILDVPEREDLLN